LFSWTFNDPDNDSQGAYQLQVDIEGTFSSFGPGEFDSGKILSSSNNILIPVVKNPGTNQLGYNTSYFWRVKVWDDNDTPSLNWSLGPAFSTETHIYPVPDFVWTPSSPAKDEFVQFCSTGEPGVCSSDISICYDSSNNVISCSGKNHLWTFPGDTTFSTTTSPSSENPQVKFGSSGTKIVMLQITDDVGTCTTTKSVGVTFPLPKWKEVKP
jgi:hypothetical protein